MNKRLIVAAITVAALALALLVANPVAAQQGINDIWNAVLMHQTLTVQGAVAHNSTLTQTGAATFAGAVTASGTMTTTGLSGNAIQTVAMSANGNGAAQTVTPTKNTLVISPTAAVTVALGLVGNGYMVTIVNDLAVNVLFPDSGNQLLGGARTVAQYDTLTVIQIGGKWHEVAFVAN